MLLLIFIDFHILVLNIDGAASNNVFQINAINAAAEAVCLILSVDETVKNPKVRKITKCLSRGTCHPLTSFACFLVQQGRERERVSQFQNATRRWEIPEFARGSGYLRQQQQDEGKREGQGGSPAAGHPTSPSAAARRQAAMTGGGPGWARGRRRRWEEKR
jgi:hypothetical protein